ncbi:MAG: hypothetical protein IKI45_08685 [Oscillospiraceae bacterium]|nr:hypothetical protein [Oscillospiraceae bacterium]
MKFTWVRLPVHLIGTISSSGLILLSMLLNRDTGTHEVRLQNAELADMMHCTVRHIDTLIRELENAGLILSRQRTQYGVVYTLAPDILPPKKRSPQNMQQSAGNSSSRTQYTQPAQQTQKRRQQQTQPPQAETCSSIDWDLVEQIMHPYGLPQDAKS